MRKSWKWSLAAVVLVAAAVGIVLANLPAAPPDLPDGEVVATDSGPVRGVIGSGTREYRGIPYAAAPVGDLRWSSPRPPGRWTEVRDATQYTEPCAQPAFPGQPARGVEDCLSLNVAAPLRTERPAPVMVWIHGGAYVWGSGADYGASMLAERGGVMVVTLNYRLGALGFLAHPAMGEASGNFGLEDQQAALRWVQRNAAAFGGDPGSVTIFGQSSGARSVCAHLVAPRSRGLFHRAIIQSEPCTMTTGPMTAGPGQDGSPSPDPSGFPRSRTSANTQGVAVAAKLGCADPATATACLRAVPASRLEEATAFQDWFGPTIGGGVLPVDPATAELPRVPIMHGITRDEYRIGPALEPPADTAAYVARIRAWAGDRADAVLARYPPERFGSAAEAWAAVITDATYAVPMRELNRRLAGKAPTYAYEFTDRAAPWMSTVPPPAFATGAYHTSELQYLFTAVGYGRPLSDAQRNLADLMIRYWAQFAHTGDPNGPGLPRWAPVEDPKLAQRLDTEGIGPVDVSAEHQVEFWR
ncbi:carboxylesterase/lipase family protein [Pseudonocardia acaciae]|uniref:carboxylesterase/lipase family protein n=1 Tax=Pseudonocardia acaciae TaxID=551276 RepID=UPI0004911526|nr:carboxylesterase family protein [Pseudonocardia acaciae]